MYVRVWPKKVLSLCFEPLNNSCAYIHVRVQVKNFRQKFMSQKRNYVFPVFFGVDSKKNLRKLEKPKSELFVYPS